MRVSGATRTAVRSVLREWSLADQSDSKVDGAVRHLRQSLGRSRSDSLDSEVAVFPDAILPLALFGAPLVQTVQEEEWSQFVWDLWKSASGGVQTKSRLQHLTSDDDAWQEACSTVADMVSVEPVEQGRSWSFWGMWLSILISGLCTGAVYFVSWTGRGSLMLTSLAIVSGTSAFFCARRFWVAKGRMSSAEGLPRSSHHSEGEPSRLQTPVRNMDRTSQVLPENGPRPGGPSELMQSLTSLSRQPDNPVLAATGASRSASWQPAIGQVVKVEADDRYRDFSGEIGVVAGLPDGLLDVKLLSGALLFSIPASCLRPHRFAEQDSDKAIAESIVEEVLARPVTEGAAAETIVSKQAEVSDLVYAPLSRQSMEQVQEQGKAVKSLLVKWSSRAALLPSWSKNFWLEVHAIKNLDPRVSSLLRTHGYLGDGAGTPPRVTELKEKLGELESSGALSHSSALFDLGGDDQWQAGLEDEEGWEATLPPDLKRAGPEIYASFRSAGARSAREWLNQMIPLEKRNDGTYIDLFNQASLVDFVIRDAKGSHPKALSLIAKSDIAEVALRRLASYVHERRTGDRDAAISMLAIKPTNLSHDIAPSWLVSEASVFSQSEFKRRERAKAHRGGGFDRGNPSEKGRGKGGRGNKKKPGGGGSKPPTTQG